MTLSQGLVRPEPRGRCRRWPDQKRPGVGQLEESDEDYGHNCGDVIGGSCVRDATRHFSL